MKKRTILRKYQRKFSRQFLLIARWSTKTWATVIKYNSNRTGSTSRCSQIPGLLPNSLWVQRNLYLKKNQNVNPPGWSPLKLSRQLLANLGGKRFFFPRSRSPSSDRVGQNSWYLAISRDRAWSIPRVLGIISRVFGCQIVLAIIKSWNFPEIFWNFADLTRFWPYEGAFSHPIFIKNAREWVSKHRRTPSTIFRIKTHRFTTIMNPNFKNS